MQWGTLGWIQPAFSLHLTQLSSIQPTHHIMWFPMIPSFFDGDSSYFLFNKQRKAGWILISEMFLSGPVQHSLGLRLLKHSVEPTCEGGITLKQFCGHKKILGLNQSITQATKSQYFGVNECFFKCSVLVGLI